MASFEVGCEFCVFLLVAFATTAARSVTSYNHTENNYNEQEMNNESPFNSEARLVDHLIQNYPPSRGIARPIFNIKNGMDVVFSMTFDELLGIDEQGGVMHVTGHVYGRWRDYYLQWDPKNYDGLDAVPLNPQDIFLPKIIPIGSTGDKTPVYDSNPSSKMGANNPQQETTIVWSDYDGNVTATANGIFDTPCKMELFNFPFDVQRCEFSFKTLRLKRARITLRIADNLCQVDSIPPSLNNNPMWSVDHVECTEQAMMIGQASYSMVVYTLVVRRRFEYYLRRILLPSATMALLQLGTFMLPFCASRVMFGITTVLIVDIFQSSHSFTPNSHKMPSNAGSTQPFALEMYTTAQLLVGILITFESIIVWRLSRGFKINPRINLQSFFKKLLIRKPEMAGVKMNPADQLASKPLSVHVHYDIPHIDGAVSCVKADQETPGNELDDSYLRETTDKFDQSGNNDARWHEIAVAFDNVAMIVFSLTIATLPFAFSRLS